MKSDIDIAHEIELDRIKNVAHKLGINRESIISYGPYIAKIPISLINKKKIRKSKLILVTAITPTKAGIGKTTEITSMKNFLQRYQFQFSHQLQMQHDMLKYQFLL